MGPARAGEFLARVRRRLDGLGWPELTATFVGYLIIGSGASAALAAAHAADAIRGTSADEDPPQEFAHRVPAGRESGLPVVRPRDRHRELIERPEEHQRERGDQVR
jgi:hypothetical protein